MNMYCPKCGKSEQEKNTFCRNCGTFLPDFDKLKSKEITPEQHLTVNLVLNALTAIASIGLAITLYAMFLGKEGTPVIIYVTAGFLTAMTAWQVQIFWRSLILRKQFSKKTGAANDIETKKSGLENFKTKELLNEADFSSYVPPTVIENTTKNLNKTPRS